MVFLFLGLRDKRPKEVIIYYKMLKLRPNRPKKPPIEKEKPPIETSSDESSFIFFSFLTGLIKEKKEDILRLLLTKIKTKTKNL